MIQGCSRTKLIISGLVLLIIFSCPSIVNAQWKVLPKGGITFTRLSPPLRLSTSLERTIFFSGKTFIPLSCNKALFRLQIPLQHVDFTDKNWWKDVSPSTSLNLINIDSPTKYKKEVKFYPVQRSTIEVKKEKEEIKFVPKIEKCEFVIDWFTYLFNIDNSKELGYGYAA